MRYGIHERVSVVGVDEEFGSQTCRSIDATKSKTDVNSRVGDEDADGRNATLRLPSDGQAVNVPPWGRSTRRHQLVGRGIERSVEEVGAGRKRLPAWEWHGRRQRLGTPQWEGVDAVPKTIQCTTTPSMPHLPITPGVAITTTQGDVPLVLIGEGAGITISAGKRCCDSLFEASCVAATPSIWRLDKSPALRRPRSPRVDRNEARTQA